MTPRILFVPVSGPGGAGEFVRSLVIARGVRARWPEAQIHFIVNAQAGYARDLEFPTTLIEGTPTYNTAAVNQVIERERPHVVVFDSSGRNGQYRCARRVGARVVYVSSRFNTRWKGFRLRRLRWLDQHWIAQPRFLDGELSRWERIKLAVVRTVEPVFLDPLFEPPDPARRGRLEVMLGLAPERYALFCIGSGGRYDDREDIPARLVDAAARVHRATGFTCVVVTGANSTIEGSPMPGVLTLRKLPHAELIDLLTGAQLAVINGGSLLLQALANRCVVVAVPVAGDQPARIRRCVEQGLALASGLDAAAIERTILKVATDATLRAQLQAAVDRLGLGNGVVTAVDAIAQLLPR